MSCFLPLNNKSFDISFIALRPTVVIVDEVVEALKHFCSATLDMGCVVNCVLRSIHGNMVILWYGGWSKKSTQNKHLLTAAVESRLAKLVSGKAIMMEHGFYDAYAGETKDGSSAAKFSTGDAVTMCVLVPKSVSVNRYEDLSYANLAVFKSSFSKMKGAVSGVCLGCPTLPRLACFYVWTSLRDCYSWLLNNSSDCRSSDQTFLHHIKYDIFTVAYVCDEWTRFPQMYSIVNSGNHMSNVFCVHVDKEIKKNKNT
ncbi:hypothetical protein LINPERPRIM_LOCUS25434 [Linum perenne]